MAEREPNQLRWRFLDWRPVARRAIAAPPPPSDPLPAEAPPARPSRELRAGFADLEEFVREVGGGRIGTPRSEGAYVTVPMRARRQRCAKTK